jgi:Tol biopolymer transport system component
LVWGAVDGPLTHTFDPGFRKLSGYWSKDNRTLAYIGEKAHTWEVGAINSTDGTRQIFFTGLPDREVISIYEPSEHKEVPLGDVMLLLKQADGKSRLFVYDQGRALNYYFGRADLQFVKRSPVDDTIYAEFGEEPDVALYLVRPNDPQHPALREHLLKTYLWPVWSPDGRLLAFTQADQYEERSLDIVDAGGELIRRYKPAVDPTSGDFFPDEWVLCEAN